MEASFTRKGRDLRSWMAPMQEEYRRGAVKDRHEIGRVLEWLCVSRDTDVYADGHGGG